MRCFGAECKRNPTMHLDIRITDINEAGQRVGEWKTVEVCNKCYDNIRSKMCYASDENNQYRGYTESRWGDIRQIVEYGSSWPISDNEQAKDIYDIRLR